jgi:hypothetical protein
MIGMALNGNATSALDWWVESQAAGFVFPYNLHASQLERRSTPDMDLLKQYDGPGYGCDPNRNNAICCIGYSEKNCPQCPAQFNGKLLRYGSGGVAKMQLACQAPKQQSKLCIQ